MTLQVTLETPFDPNLFERKEFGDPDDDQYVLVCNLGIFTVVDRLTGFGWRDIETGWREPNGNFWLASGYKDVTVSGAKTFGEAIQWVKDNANTCIPK